MKKIISYLALLAALTSMTACGSQESVSYNSPVPSAVTEITVTTGETTNIPETSVSTETTTTSAASETASAVTETAAAAGQTLQPAEEKTNDARNLPVINSAEFVAEYNDFGNGYMFRLDMTGDYAYWNADIKEVSEGREHSKSMSSEDLTDYYPYITGGSTISAISAVVTPYDQNGNAGAPVTVEWDPNRIQHEAVRFFGNDHDTANSYGYYPYSEKLIEKLGPTEKDISVEDIEGEWLHGQFMLRIYDCDKTCGRFADEDESGSYTGTVKLEYSIAGNNIILWYNLYTDDGRHFKYFKAAGARPVNEITNEYFEGMVHTRIIKD